ncbi:MAG: hypothetical protein COA92_10115 [Sulfurovum sp.]|nr:MAG: hypothetical protein COA92_10115 [Sulfurovum sp.]
MKKLLFSSLVGFALIALTGCTTGNDAAASTKCSADGKCSTAKKCQANAKCAGDKAKKVAKKCSADGKCG